MRRVSLAALVLIAGWVGSTGSGLAADAALGEYLAGDCATCHRADGAAKGIPAIVGWPVQPFIEALTAYRDKSRANVVMQTIAGRLSDDEIAALAVYYARLGPAR